MSVALCSDAAVNCGALPPFLSAIAAESTIIISSNNSSSGGGGTLYGASYTVTCPPLSWFYRDVYSQTISCAASGHWVSDLPTDGSYQPIGAGLALPQCEGSSGFVVKDS